MNRLRARHVRALVAGGVVVGTIVVAAGNAPAAVGSFDGSASATGARMIFFADKAPATKTPIDGGGPVAQAVLDSLGTSNALASNPYPGDVFLAGPGLAAGAFGAPSLPGYPFIARAEHPVTPEQSTSTPFGDFAASATESAAKGTATTGGGSGDSAIGRAISDAGVRVDGDLVIAEAQSTAQAIRIGELKIGGVRSLARVVLKPDGTLERTADVAFDDATVAGVPVVFTPAGVVPAPGIDPPVGITPADQLEESGIQVVQLNREDTPDGVVAGGLQITKAQDFGPGGPGYIRFVFGQATARARGEATVLAAPAETASGEPAPASAERATPGVILPTGLFPVPHVLGAAVSGDGATFDPADLDEGAGVGLGSSASAGAPAFEGAATGTVAGAADFTPGPATSTSPSRRASEAAARPVRLAVADANRLDAGPIYTALLLAAVVGGAAIQLVRFFAGR